MNRPTVLVAFLTILAATAQLYTQPAPAIPPPIKITVKPATPPTPAMKYRLLPELRDTTPGNAVQFYYRAFSPEWQGYRRDHKAYMKIHEAAQAPMKDVPRDEVAGVVTGSMLKEVDRAARKQFCDWNMIERLREEGITYLLPDVQAMREFAALLKLRAKVELLDSRHDKAAYTLQTGLSMGRHVGDAPTLIQALVGLAISQVMLSEIDEWIELPDAPNLYWALSDLPRPLISLRKPFQGERIMIDTYFPGYRAMLLDPKLPPASAQQVEEQIDRFLSLGVFPEFSKHRALFVAWVMRNYPEAKKFLAAKGRTAEQIEAIPALQVVLLYEVAQYDELYEELYKHITLPYWEGRPGLKEVDKKLKEIAENAGGAERTLATALLPSVTKVYGAHARLDRKVAALRCVEAIRAYAAAHDGKLPSKLDDVKEVPIPFDPYSGKPFVYEVKDNKAYLTGVAPLGEDVHVGTYICYEITIKK